MREHKVETVGKFEFYIWDSAITGERNRVDLDRFEFICAACGKGIHYEKENMYGVIGLQYICFTERCKILFVLQNI